MVHFIVNLAGSQRARMLGQIFRVCWRGRVFLEEINIGIHRLSKANFLSLMRVGFIQPIEQNKGLRKGEFTLSAYL